MYLEFVILATAHTSETLNATSKKPVEAGS